MIEFDKVGVVVDISSGLTVGSKVVAIAVGFPESFEVDGAWVGL